LPFAGACRKTPLLRHLFQEPPMADFAAARRMMVDGQIRTADVTDPRIIAAFLAVPRERFVAPSMSALAYLDFDAPAADGPSGRRLLKPMVLAKMIQAAQIGEDERVLIVGCASGYPVAIVSPLAGSVVGLEEEPALAARASDNAAALTLPNIEIVRGPLAAGWPAGGPYDVILAAGCIEILPDTLTRQLRDGGRLVCVRGGSPAPKATIYRADDGNISGRPIFDATAPMLPGFSAAPAFVF
jgi:protein-L-isoaspartate(D-aspartate) O-methyltransferase